MEPGVRRFFEDMAGLGLNPSVEAGLVTYQITAVEGAYAGVGVETGVSVDELTPWPQAPPHWVHFSASINFRVTNSQTSPKAGWLMHSRQISGWGDAPPAIGWCSHVRAVLSEAIS